MSRTTGGTHYSPSVQLWIRTTSTNLAAGRSSSFDQLESIFEVICRIVRIGNVALNPPETVADFRCIARSLVRLYKPRKLEMLEADISGREVELADLEWHLDDFDSPIHAQAYDGPISKAYLRRQIQLRRQELMEKRVSKERIEGVFRFLSTLW
nr:hypothetical protein CFP56_77556 [Quercus suber]